MQEHSDSLVFDQVQQIADTRIRENIQRALARMNIEDVDDGLTRLSREFEHTLKRYLLAARLKGRLETTPNPDPDKWMLANMIDCAVKHKIIVDRPTLAYLKEVRNRVVHGISLDEREILLRNIHLLAGLYIDYIKLLNDYTLQLIPDENMDEEKMLHLSVSDYLKLNGCVYQGGHILGGKNNNSPMEDWGDIARELALSSDTTRFMLTLYSNLAGTDKAVTLPPELAASPLLQTLEKTHNFIEIKPDSVGTPVCIFTSPEALRFVKWGDWLGIYVWNEVRKAAFANDYQWGGTFSIINAYDVNTLDMALTYRGQLLIGKFYTSYNPFGGKRHYLEELISTAHLLGGTSITKVFITNQPKTRPHYEWFNKQADELGIVVFTSEDLPAIGNLLEEQAKTPKYAKI